MENLKKPLSFDEQLLRLSDHNILYEDGAKVKAVLSQINYYRLSGYALSFRVSPGSSDCIKNTKFADICRLNDFDTELRHILRKYLEIVENYYKTQISYHFAMSKCSIFPHDQHYDSSNYYQKKEFTEIKNSFQKEKNYYKDSLIVKHHNSKYGGKMPLWVIVELLSFSNTSKLYHAMYDAEKKLIASFVGVGADTLANHLHCLSVLRNKCSHGARLYNTILYPSVRLNASFLRKHPDIRSDSVYAYLLVLVRRLPESSFRSALCDEIESLIIEYSDALDLSLIGFPIHFMAILRNSI